MLTEKDRKEEELMKYLDDFIKSDLFVAQQNLIEERKKTIKTGPDVVHLEYLGHLLVGPDLNEIEEELKRQNLRFSYFNKSGIWTNEIEDYSLTAFFIISRPIIKILLEEATKATWDLLKFIVVKTWIKIKGNKKASDKNLKFGIKVALDEHTSFDLEIGGDEKQVIAILDKILPFLKQQQKSKERKMFTDYVYYDKKGKELIKIDVTKEIKKKTLNQKRKRKKGASVKRK